MWPCVATNPICMGIRLRIIAKRDLFERGCHRSSLCDMWTVRPNTYRNQPCIPKLVDAGIFFLPSNARYIWMYKLRYIKNRYFGK
jgi:hypothetical protein